MKRNDPSSNNNRFSGRLVTAILLVVACASPSLLHAQIDCSPPGRKSPATTVPECVDANGFAVNCTAGSIRLWPSEFRPASDIPLTRDSTDRVAGKTIPGRKSGHELFSSVDVVTVGGISRRLYVAYNAGLQVWDIATDPAVPIRLDTIDGWEGEFLKFPAVSEVLNYIEDINAVSVNSTVDVVGVAGKRPVGVSFWDFNTTTGNFKRLYQDEGITARQIRMIKRGTKIYGIVGGDDGLAIYDVSAARAQSNCLDDQGSNCGSVFLGYVTQQGSRYIDAILNPVNNRIYVSAANGLFSYLDLWELGNPQNPATAILRMTELQHTAGSAIFRYDGHYYLGLISELDGLNKEELRVLLIDDCVNGLNCSFANGRVKDVINPIQLQGYSTANDFLTYSVYDGKPYLYYGFATGNLQGPDLERLFDASSLRPPSPSPLPGLPEITAGGGSYSDPCSGETIRYWSHYYNGNHHGLNNMVPRVGRFGTSGHFYRAAATILDVHVLGDGASPGASSITTAVTSPQNEYWMSDLVSFNAAASGDCTPSPLSWNWSANSDQIAVDPVQIAEATNTASYSFECTAVSGRCANALASVQAANSAVSCAESEIVPAAFTVKDPAIAIVDANTGATDVFAECQTIPFAADLAGRGPVWWEWRIDGDTFESCSSNVSTAGDLEETVVGCEVPGEVLRTAEIFADGFESGDTTVWTSDPELLARSAKGVGGVEKTAELLVWDSPNKALPAKDSRQVTFTIVGSGTPAFSGAPQEVINGPSATLVHPAVNATSWSWEFEDPSGGESCNFPDVGQTSCVRATTTTDEITHIWPSPGSYEYRVTVANCGEDTATRTDEVTVVAGVEPDVLTFGFRGLQPNCCGSPLTGFTCQAGAEVEFLVRMAENANYVFKFDWDRPTATGGSFATENASSNDPAKLEWYFKHTFNSSGTFFPVVRAQNGGTDDRNFIYGSLQVGTCN